MEQTSKYIDELIIKTVITLFSFSIDVDALNQSIDLLANQDQNSITNTVFSNGYFDPWLNHGTISSYGLGVNVTVINIDCKYITHPLIKTL